jgi:hypothetical protein
LFSIKVILLAYTTLHRFHTSLQPLEQIDAFEIGHKLYGDTNRHADRILQTFQGRKGSTGVLLAGEKGSGKTLLAKRISILAALQDIPTIVINNNWKGDPFNQFLQSIEQAVIVILDEFEKVYATTQDQSQLLTLLDGVYPTKKLFLLTCNDKARLNQNMMNRPGRIFYALDFSGVGLTFIRAYCEDNLVAKDHVSKVCAVSQAFTAFNFDLLKALVEEMNRYGETPAEALKFLNARPEASASAFQIMLQDDEGEEIDTCPHCSIWHGNPLLGDGIDLHCGYKKCENFCTCGMPFAQFSANELVQITANNGYVFRSDEDGSCLTLSRPQKRARVVDFEALQSIQTAGGQSGLIPLKKTISDDSE